MELHKNMALTLDRIIKEIKKSSIMLDIITK